MGGGAGGGTGEISSIYLSSSIHCILCILYPLTGSETGSKGHFVIDVIQGRVGGGYVFTLTRFVCIYSL